MEMTTSFLQHLFDIYFNMEQSYLNKICSMSCATVSLSSNGTYFNMDKFCLLDLICLLLYRTYKIFLSDHMSEEK